MKRSPLRTIVLSLLLASCAGAPPNTQSGNSDFTITTKNKDDKAEIQYENGVATITILSPSGIGAATFQLESGVMPGKVILHLHLKGLEQIRLSSAGENIGASVSSGGEPTFSQQAISSGTESPILPGDPLWMEIEIVSSREEKRIPLEEGYFKIRLPKEFLQKAGTSFTVEWIDFYR